jgi:hypothetical protein
VGRLNRGQRVALIGIEDPAATLHVILRRMHRAARPDFSFTTGLRPTVRRPFRLHFLPTGDAPRLRELESLGITPIDACLVG